MGSSRVGSNPTCSEQFTSFEKTTSVQSRTHSLVLQKNPLIAAMAEWLRRLTRNQMGSSRVGLNPTRNYLDGLGRHFSTNVLTWTTRGLVGRTVLGNGLIHFQRFFSILESQK